MDDGTAAFLKEGLDLKTVFNPDQQPLGHFANVSTVPADGLPEPVSEQAHIFN